MIGASALEAGVMSVIMPRFPEPSRYGILAAVSCLPKYEVVVNSAPLNSGYW